ncbi:hypothetical protein BGW42_000954 [Actinomortierella wolfii]|nr:hypothetical protein BGW42_000954 [Actinomortierella wolfii]
MTLVPSDGEEHQGNQQRQLSPTWLDRVGTPTRFLCVSNVPKDISIFAARELFEAFGDLKGIFTTFVATHGIIYIELFDIRNAIEVVRQLQMTIVKGHVLHIRHCSKLEMSSVSRDILENENDGIVLVSMSHPLLKEEELLRLMDRFGNIMSYKNQLNREATTILVEYYDTRHATAAVVGIQEMNREGIAQCHAMYARHMQPCDIQESYTERTIPFSRSVALHPISPVSRFGLSMDAETSMDLTLVSSSANALQSRDGADVVATTARLLDSINVSSLCNNLSSCTISKLTSEDSIAPKKKPGQTSSNATASSRAICSSSEDTKDTDRSNKSTTHSTSQSTTPHVPVNTTSTPKSRSSRRARSLSEESNSATPKTPCSSSSLTGSTVTAISIPTTPTSTKDESPDEQVDSTSGRSCSLYDLIEGYRGANDKRTTFMIRDIPNKYTQQMLYELISKTHRGKFDFLYLRIDFKNKCNVGYAFINFVNVE